MRVGAEKAFRPPLFCPHIRDWREIKIATEEECGSELGTWNLLIDCNINAYFPADLFHYSVRGFYRFLVSFCPPFPFCEERRIQCSRLTIFGVHLKIGGLIQWSMSYDPSSVS